MKTELKTKVLLTSLILFFIFSSFGYSIEKYGVISGTVMDDSGATLPGIQVMVTGKNLMGKKISFTNENGVFRIGKLPVGSDYSVEMTLEGFKKVVKKNVAISLGKTTKVSAIMKLGVITETIVVTGKELTMDPTSSTNQVNITNVIVERLANDRQYQSVMEMMPGAIPGNNPAMMGGSDTDNMYQFDGADATDPYTKTWSTAANFDNFEEMQVISQGASAEYGRGTGAVINVVTKSGSNQLHGIARISMADVDWNADATPENNNFKDATRYINETRPSINLGGPIIKDHIWFFGSYEKRNKFIPVMWYDSVDDAIADVTTTGKGYYQGHYASMKITANFGKLSLVGSWSEDPIKIPNLLTYIGYTWGYYSDLARVQGGHNFNFEATIDLGTNTYALGRVALKRGELNNESNERDFTVPWTYNTAGFATGPLDEYLTSRDFNQYQLNVNHFAETGFGYHDLKIGAELFDINLVMGINSGAPSNEEIYYTPDGTDYVRYVYTQAPNQANVGNKNLTFYIQDKWEVTKNLTVNLGVRMENGKWINHAEETVMDLSFGQNLAPNLGLAYSFGKNKLTFNIGRMFDIYGSEMVNQLQPADFVREMTTYYGPAITGIPGWTEMGTEYATAPPGATTIAEDISPSYRDEIGIGFERLIGTKYALSLSYLHREFKNRIEDFDPENDGVLHYKNASYADPLQDVDWGKTYKKYDAVILTFKKNLGDDKFQFLASYTYSKLKGFVSSGSDLDRPSGGGTESDWGINPYHANNSFGYLPNDVRHMLKFNGSVILPFDINMGMSFSWYSGMPYTNYGSMLYEDGGVTGHDQILYAMNVDPLGSSGRLQATWRLDLRIEKSIRIKDLFTASVYFDAFNLLNQQNPIERRNDIGDGYFDSTIGGSYTLTHPDARFGGYNEFHAPMSMKIGAKIEW